MNLKDDEVTASREAWSSDSSGQAETRKDLAEWKLCKLLLAGSFEDEPPN